MKPLSKGLQLAAIGAFALAGWGLFFDSDPKSFAPADAPARAMVAAAESSRAADDLLRLVEPRLTAGRSWKLAVDEASPTRMRFHVIYSEMPLGPADYESASRSVVKAALDVLVEQGRRPSREGVFISAWPRLPQRGETGKPLVAMWGRAYYDANTDQIIWKPLKQ